MIGLNLLKYIVLARALYSAAELNIAEHIGDTKMSAQEIAVVVHADADCLSRMLDFLVLHDVFLKNRDGSYENNQASHEMRADHEQSIKPFLLHDDPTRWNCYGNLTYSLQTGKPAFNHLYGVDYFEYISKQQPELGKRFDEAMTIISQTEDALIAKKLSFQGTVADIGGGKGQLVKQLSQRHQLDKLIVFDLPEVIAACPLLDAMFEKKSGSFFESIELQADIFILKRILHDWDDQQATAILKNVAIAMSPGSKLYIIEGLLDKTNNRAELAAIDLLLLTIFGGKERTLDDFKRLATAAGLQVATCHELNGMIFAIECKK